MAPKRLILCFDGTGNKFSGDRSDTNIVKLYQMFSRTNENQFHYYQPGIGTYSTAKKSGIGGPISKLSGAIEETVDQGVATSFEEHIAAGYRFLMRYYSEGDQVYIFGFSRGAYTGRFLSEMLENIGLLSMGNEEMVYFAWQAFSNYQRVRGTEDAKTPKVNAETLKANAKTPKAQAEAFMTSFKNTYCRPEFKVYFLGLFDCVNSVGQFDVPFTQHQFTYIPSEPATHIRHAVSIHERRVKFKPALFLMDNQEPNHDTKEMWFAGNHGDVGGGWEPQPEPKKGDKVSDEEEEKQKRLHSDSALEWMLDELNQLENSKGPQDEKLEFKPGAIKEVKERQDLWRKQVAEKLKMFEGKEEKLRPHDMLAFRRGAKFFMTLFWWLLEFLPTTRLEHEERTDEYGLKKWEWVYRYYPNTGVYRDIPQGAKVHSSVNELMEVNLLGKGEVELIEKHLKSKNDTNAPVTTNGTSKASTKRKQK